MVAAPMQGFDKIEGRIMFFFKLRLYGGHFNDF
jgi:hypothetical protein